MQYAFAKLATVATCMITVQFALDLWWDAVSVQEMTRVMFATQVNSFCSGVDDVSAKWDMHSCLRTAVNAQKGAVYAQLRVAPISVGTGMSTALIAMMEISTTAMAVAATAQ